MKKILFISFSCCILFSLMAKAQRIETLLEKNWKFTKGEVTEAMKPEFDDRKWETVTVPHDWAIFGPFDRSNDLQEVAVTQNFEKKASVKTGRTGGLPYVGIGWYRTTFDAPANQQTTLVFDGAMSEARVYVNGQEACFWPFGYNSFHCDVTGFLKKDGKNNILAVRLENKPQSSRWYPGAGLYRNVRVVSTDKVHVPVWGTQLTTPHVADEYASVRLLTTIANDEGKDIRIVAAEPASCPKLTRGQFQYDFGDETGYTPLLPMFTLGHNFAPANIHAGGLRYHGAGSIVSQLKKDGLMDAVDIQQLETFKAATLFAQSEGIIPAPESSHAIAAAIREAEQAKIEGKPRTILFNLSGHGLIDMAAYDQYLAGDLTNYEVTDADVEKNLSEIEKIIK